VLTEGARKVYRGRQGARGRHVGQGCSIAVQSCLAVSWRIEILGEQLSARTMQKTPILFCYLRAAA
jgi:hypothetical protein